MPTRRRLRGAASASTALFLIVEDHGRNLKCFAQDGIPYPVPDGAAAYPSDVQRSARNRDQRTGCPDFHYTRSRMDGDRTAAELVPVGDAGAVTPVALDVRDRFDCRARRIPPMAWTDRHSSRRLIVNVIIILYVDLGCGAIEPRGLDLLRLEVASTVASAPGLTTRTQQRGPFLSLATVATDPRNS